MLGAAITNFALLFKQRDYKLDKPVIDYDIALILTPTIIFGADLGVSLSDKWSDIATTSVYDRNRPDHSCHNGAFTPFNGFQGKCLQTKRGALKNYRIASSFNS